MEPSHFKAVYENMSDSHLVFVALYKIASDLLHLVNGKPAIIQNSYVVFIFSIQLGIAEMTDATVFFMVRVYRDLSAHHG